MRNRFNFVTHCTFHSSVKNVWDVTVDVAAYPDWWPSVNNVIIEGNSVTIQEGSKIHYSIKGFLPHTLHFQTHITRYIPYSRIEMSVNGDLEGTGLSMLEEQHDTTLATFQWDVELMPPVLNRLNQYRPFHKLFAWNHDFSMRSAIKNMKKRVHDAAA